MKGEAVLITGGAGYIGSHIVVELAEAGYEPIIVDNFVNANKEVLHRLKRVTGRDIQCYSLDLLHEGALDEVFKKHKIDFVIHAAALKAVGESVEMPLLYYKNNLIATINLLQSMKAHNVKRIVFSSSATVYGNPQRLPLDESHPVGNCTNPYGKTKLFIEEILKDIHTSDPEFRLVILRYFNPVGAHKSGLIGEDPKGVPNNLMPFVAQVAIGRRPEVKIYGSDYDTPDGTGVRDYIHVVDLAKGHVAALKKLAEPDCGCKVYNLGTGQGISVLQIVKAMETACGHALAYSMQDRRAGDLTSLYADTKLAEKELGWKAERSVQEMCADLWNWQQKNPNGFDGPLVQE